MAEKKSTKKAPASAKSSTKAAAAKRSPKAKAASGAIAGGNVASAGGKMISLGEIKPAKGSWPKRTRVGRGHGSGMVKTGGEGGKGQTVRSGGGKGPAFEGGQTPWARRLPHKRGYSQKGRDIGHFRTTFAVINLHQLEGWDAAVAVTPQSLREKGLLKAAPDGVKILGGSKDGKSLPTGLQFRDVLFSASAREALAAAGASLGDDASAKEQA
jgi:large subunit ribosomal protein L15